MNTSLVVLYCSNVAATWTLIAKEPFRSQASPCTIRGRPNHTTMSLSPSTSVPPPPFHQYSLLVFNSSSWGRMKVT
jgi:hypothetical protein